MCSICCFSFLEFYPNLNKIDLVRERENSIDWNKNPSRSEHVNEMRCDGKNGCKSEYFWCAWARSGHRMCTSWIIEIQIRIQAIKLNNLMSRRSIHLLILRTGYAILQIATKQKQAEIRLIDVKMTNDRRQILNA